MSLKRSSISIIIPVFHEANIINLVLDEIMLHDALHLKEVIVVDCIGDTIAAVEPKYLGWAKLQLLKSKTVGRALQMNTGASKASADILLFLHADTVLPRNALFYVIDLMRNSKLSAGAFDLSFDNNSLTYKLLANMATWRSRLLKCPYGDQALFVRKDVFEQMTGFMPMSLFEEVDFCRRMKRIGHELGFVKLKVVTSSSRYKKCFGCRVMRNGIITLMYYFGVDVEKLAKLYN